MLQTHVSGSAENGSFRDGAVQHLAIAHEQPLMLAGCSNGLVQLYDLRQSQRAAASVQPHRTPMVSCVRAFSSLLRAALSDMLSHTCGRLLAVHASLSNTIKAVDDVC